MDRALIRAQGHALALLAVLLARSGVVSAEAFADLLGVHAAVTAENDPAGGDILALWATMVRDSALSPRRRGWRWRQAFRWKNP